MIDRCKEDGFVDWEDVHILAVRNCGEPERTTSYGEIVLAIGQAVIAQGRTLKVPNLGNYDQTQMLQAPSDWIERWSDPATAPDQYELGAAFDYRTAVSPDGRPLLIDGPGGHSWELYLAHEERRKRVLDARKNRREAGLRSGVPT